MRMGALAGAAAMIALAVGAASAQELTATQLLDQVYQRYAAIKSYQDTFTINNQVGEGQAAVSGEMAFRRPDRLTVTVVAGGQTKVVIDGKDRWVYDVGLKQYTQESLAGETGWAAISLGGADLGLGLSDAVNTVHLLLAGQPVTDSLTPPKLAKDNAIGDLGVHVVDLAMPEDQPFEGTFELWIGKDDNLVHRMIAHARVGAGGRSVAIEIDELHKDIKVDQELGDDVFTFTPPADAKRVDMIGIEEEVIDDDSLVGKPAPDMKLTDLNGKKVSIASFKGKPLVIHVWASWDAASLREMPDLEAIYKAGKAKGLAVLGIAAADAEEHVKHAVEATGVSYPVLLDPDDEFSMEYGVFLPGVVYVDKQGVVRAIDDGLINRGHALARLAALSVEVTVPPAEMSPLRKARNLRTEGVVAFLTGHDDTAVSRFQAAADTVPYDAGAWLSLGELDLALGRYDEAVKPFDQATALEPGNPELAYEIGSAYLKHGAPPEKAVAKAQQATEAQPEDPRYWQLLGQAQLAAGDVEAALTALNNAAERNPRDPSIQFDLGTAYEKKGDKEAALTAYRSARKSGYPGAAEAVKRLEQ